MPGGAVTNNNLVWRQVTFVPLTTSKIRVNISNALANYSRVMEVEAWGIAAAGNAPPDVSITSPAEGAALTTPGDITINATAGDSGGTVTSVDFFANGAPIGTDTTSPYSVTWSNVRRGLVHAHGRRDRQRRRDDDLERGARDGGGERSAVGLDHEPGGRRGVHVAGHDRGDGVRQRQRRHRRVGRVLRERHAHRHGLERAVHDDVGQRHGGHVHADGRRHRQQRRDDDVERRARDGHGDPRAQQRRAGRERRRRDRVVDLQRELSGVGRDQRRSPRRRLGRGRRLERRHVEFVARLVRGRLHRHEVDRRSRRLLDAGQLQRARRADADDDVHLLRAEGVRGAVLERVRVGGRAGRRRHEQQQGLASGDVLGGDDVEDPHLHHERAQQATAAWSRWRRGAWPRPATFRRPCRSPVRRRARRSRRRPTRRSARPRTTTAAP